MNAAMVFRIFLFLASFAGARNQVARLARGARDFWLGKKIAVIGPTASGKDSFLSRLQNQEIPEVHHDSPMGEKVKSFRVKLVLSHNRVLDISCKGVLNTGGEAGYRDEPSGWLAACKDADVVFYMMTIEDLSSKRYLKGGRVRQDLDWLQTALPHFKQNALIHILINKIDEEIESHADYQAMAKSLSKELRSLDKIVKKTLHPYEARYSGATLISMKNKQIYTLALNDALRAVYSAFHQQQSQSRNEERMEG